MAELARQGGGRVTPAFAGAATAGVGSKASFATTWLTEYLAIGFILGLHIWVIYGILC